MNSHGLGCGIFFFLEVCALLLWGHAVIGNISAFSFAPYGD